MQIHFLSPKVGYNEITFIPISDENGRKWMKIAKQSDGHTDEQTDNCFLRVRYYDPRMDSRALNFQFLIVAI